ncbi:zf-C3HC-domain-containing protein [Phanerochaete sordida]|uniref:Zf-C3HC-domain-containing protein n=1 Tax=Phanerochaete sordida TaxID=48140 RepID=A0A9P3LHB3_9APHY|nr:zf-C3HC-domain-containing protein [Phanerochaete sordida]
MSTIAASGSSPYAASGSNVASGTIDSSGDRSFKRKFEDAIHKLDEAVGSPISSEAPPPSKRAKLSRSLYSTLAKYGITKDSKEPASTSRLDNLAKTAPHFVSILNRAATRTRKSIPFKPGHTPSLSVLSAPSTASEYRPSSTTSFLSRLSTYKLTTYANKPSAIDAVAAAKCGWVNEGKDRLVCGICGVSWVVANSHGMTRDAAAALVEKMRTNLVAMHKDGCPWKSKQCEDSIYRVPLQTPLATTRELKARAAKLDVVIKDVQIKHPLSAAQIQALLAVLRSFKLHKDTIFGDPDSDTTSMDADEPGEPSETAILAALFGWTIVLPTTPSEVTQPTSISRSASVAPSTPRRPAHNLNHSSISRSSTPVPLSPQPSFTTRGGGISAMSVASASASAISRAKPDSTLLFCPLCQRRVGLWAFIPQPHTNGEPVPMPSGPSLAGEASSQPRRQLDVLREHRSYCPYVVKSTVLPSPPVAPASRQEASLARAEPYVFGSGTSSLPVNGQLQAIEGWRAVMSMVLRYGATQRQRLGRSRSIAEPPATRNSADTDARGEGEVPELDQVDAMVEGVKTRGGRDLLKYVKGLLG